ncbi:MAG: aspartate kinase [Bacteroidota bacterium]
MIVMKFGGTSVGSPVRMHDVARIINNGRPVIVVLSAVSGTTNKLVDIAYDFSNGKKEDGLSKISILEASYSPFINELYTTKEKKTEAAEFLKNIFDQLRSFARNGFGMKQYREVLAQGEIISTQLFFWYMLEQNKNAVLINALEFMRVDENGEPVMWYLQENMQRLLTAHKDFQFIITQGFICRNPLGEIDNLKRGGSDYSASLIGAAIQAEEIQIWTDIDGMHNNDPRIVENTYPVRHLSFDEAAELAYFGAKILHPSSVNPARSAGIPVRLKNTMDPTAAGTLISADSEKGIIKAVAAKDNIIAVRIVSNRMLLAYGFLRNVFEVFERYKTPIDMISTSEVAVSVTIENEQYLKQIENELAEIATVEVDRDMTIIAIVGDDLSDRRGYASQVFMSLKEIPVRMVSFGGSKNNVSLLVEKKYKNEALRALNEGLFNPVMA